MLLTDGARFVRGLRSLKPRPRTAGEVEAAQRALWLRRDQRFLEVLDASVWPWRQSPTRRLLDAAGLEPHDVRSMVEQDDLDTALNRLRDLGVYVAYEEWLGRQPARRGSTVMHFEPEDFFNPAVPADFVGMSGGSRSGGTPVAGNFAQLRALGSLGAGEFVVRDVLGAPSAAWFPLLPSMAGIATMMHMLAAGNQPDAWFTQVDASDLDVSARKQAVNRLLPYAARLAGIRLPHPVTVRQVDPEPVLDWVEAALRRAPRALLVTYVSTGLQLSRAAVERGQRLDGLVLAVSGEPLTPSRAQELRESGAEPSNVYGTAQFGVAGLSCPHSADEALHVAETALAVGTRRRERSDGEVVDALLFTTLDTSAGSVLVNVENDDVGVLTIDESACACLWGRIGVRQRLRNIRGMSKVVTSGMTVRGDVFQTLVDLLPGRCGGSATDYQFVEVHEDDVARLVLRIDPRLGNVDEASALATVREHLRDTEVGRLADDVWSAHDALQVERSAPIRTRVGKVLALETLR